jgi:hypothetical protein
MKPSVQSRYQLVEDLLPRPDSLSGMDMGFELVEGFSRPNWKAIQGFIKEHVLKDELPDVWKFVAKCWLRQLASDLGGGCQIFESQSFYCLSDLVPEITDDLISFAESTVQKIRQTLREAAWTGFYGKHVLLLFSDADDYYSYISYLYKEGEHPLTGGMFIRVGYGHIAVPFVTMHFAQSTLVHELVHNLLCHLPIPSWLNEGLAVTIERLAVPSSSRINQDLVNEHLEHWNEKNIQAFWAGKSFRITGQDNKLSYSLAEVFVNLLLEKGPDFVPFVRTANGRDAGQAAALAIFGCDLGDIAATFLGPGNWRPNLKAMAGYWNQDRKTRQ